MKNGETKSILNDLEAMGLKREWLVHVLPRSGGRCKSFWIYPAKDKGGRSGTLEVTHTVPREKILEFAEKLPHWEIFL